MGFLFDGGARASEATVAASALRIQSSLRGQPIARVWGQTRIAANMIGYYDFKSVAQKSTGDGGKGGSTQGGGGKGTSGTTGYNYFATVMLGLCVGPIADVLVAWNGKTPQSLQSQGFSVFKGSLGQAPWSVLTTRHPTEAIGYTALAFVASDGLALGSVPELPNFNWEVRSALSSAVLEYATLSTPYTFIPTYFSLSASAIERAAIPSGSPYRIQAADPNAVASTPVVLGNFNVGNGSQGGGKGSVVIPGSISNGVVFEDTGLPLTKVASGPTTGQYTVTSAGLYTFAAVDAGKDVIIIDLAIAPGVNYVRRPTATVTAGNKSVTAISSMTGVAVGQVVTGTGIPPGTVVQALPGGSVATLSNPATAGGTGVTLTFFGSSLKQVLSSPGVGEYTLNVTGAAYGKYTFSSADNGKLVAVIDIPDADPSLVVIDYLTGLTSSTGFAPSFLSPLTQMSNYAYANGLFVSPAETSQRAIADFLDDMAVAINGEFVWSNGVLDFVPYGDQTVSAYGKTYVPADTPIYSLGEPDFLENQGSVGSSAHDSPDPVVFNRARQSEAFNIVRTEYLDRGRSYNPDVAEAKDDAQINTFGARPEDKRVLHMFCYEESAMQSSHLQLGRQQVRNTYSFTLPWFYMLLDPMDIVEITDLAIGLDAQTVRIKEVTENSDGSFALIVEDYLVGTGSTPLYGNQPKAGYIPNYNVYPGLVNPPNFLTVPVQLAVQGGLEVWMAVSGVDLTLWGGTQVWVSSDDATYKEAPSSPLTGPCRQGYLTAVMPSHVDPDSTNTMHVDLAISGATLASGTLADADAFNTLIAVDEELMSYETATLTGGFAYDLVYLRRGAFGTSISKHGNVVTGNTHTSTTIDNLSSVEGIYLHQLVSGAGVDAGTIVVAVGATSVELSQPTTATAAGVTLTFLSTFSRLDNQTFIYPFDKSRIGETIYVKFPSFNTWGGALQDISTLIPYTFVLQGPPIPGAVQNFVAAQIGGSVALSWDDLENFAVKGYNIYYGQHDSGFANTTLLTQASRTTETTTVSIPPGLWDIYIQAQDVADQVGPLSMYVLSVSTANSVSASQRNSPNWPGTRIGLLLHYTGVLFPESSVLANTESNSALFTTFCPNPVILASYQTLVIDTGFDSNVRVWYTLLDNAGPGVVGSPVVTFGLEHWLTGESPPGVFEPWITGVANLRYFDGLITENTTVPTVIRELTLSYDTPLITSAAQNVLVAAAGTTFSFAALGMGPFHSPPSVNITPTGGLATSGQATAVSATQFTATLFSGATPVQDVCNITVIGA